MNVGPRAVCPEYQRDAQASGSSAERFDTSTASLRVALVLSRAVPLVIWLLLTTGLFAQTTDSSAAVLDPRLLLVVGAAGTPEYREQFEHDADRWRKLADSRKIELVEIRQDAADAQRDQLKTAIEAAQEENAAQLWIVFIGHGTSERGVHKFNLDGPDVSSRELAQWLARATQPVIFISCSSASAPFLPELSAPGRIVITATRSGSENNYSRFGSQLAASLLDPSTDIDHDEEVSLLEAFLAASAKTEQFYREQSRLATEHALIDDNGDKLGTGADFFRGTRAVKAAQGGKELDGQVASKIILYSDPALPQLSPDDQARRAEIEAKIDQLRARKPMPPTEEYWNELEELLLQLAELYSNAS